MVITQAAAANESVVGLVYVCAFAPDHGESAFELSLRFPGSSLGEALVAYPVTTGGNEFAIRQDRYHEQFAADLPEARAAVMAATQRPVTEAALSEVLPTDRPAWKDIPSWFAIGAGDRNVPAALQRFEAERAGARGVRDVAGGSHALAVSDPQAVAETILAAVDAATVQPTSTV
jgi:pimeloyl-ACP methyl ester carboxylesterase